MSNPQKFANTLDLDNGVRRLYDAILTDKIYRVWPATRKCDDDNEATHDDSMRYSSSEFHKIFIHESEVEAYVTALQKQAESAAHLIPEA